MSCCCIDVSPYEEEKQRLINIEKKADLGDLKSQYIMQGYYNNGYTYLYEQPLINKDHMKAQKYEKMIKLNVGSHISN